MWHHYQKLSACLSACTEGYTGKKYTLDFSNPRPGSNFTTRVVICAFIQFLFALLLKELGHLMEPEVKDRLFIVTFILVCTEWHT